MIIFTQPKYLIQSLCIAQRNVCFKCITMEKINIYASGLYTNTLHFFPPFFSLSVSLFRPLFSSSFNVDERDSQRERETCVFAYSSYNESGCVESIERERQRKEERKWEEEYDKSGVIENGSSGRIRKMKRGFPDCENFLMQIWRMEE